MTSSEIARATAPARWLLQAGVGGVALTQTHALARSVVREAAERWPGWWDFELFGPPHRETDLALLHALHDGLKRLRLVRRRGRRLITTSRGRELVEDPAALLAALAGDLGADDPFTEAVAAAVCDSLTGTVESSNDELARSALARVQQGGWHDAEGRPPSERDVSWVVGDVLRRGEAYGLVDRPSDAARPRLRGSRITLSAAGTVVLGGSQPNTIGDAALIFDAELLNVPGVRAQVAVGANQHLTALHDAIQEAFGWYDDHLYSFWLDGGFWGAEELELTTPESPDEGRRTADVPLRELDLAVGSEIAYVFDFGDEWRVLLALRERTPAIEGPLPRVLRREGSAPPQYAAADEE